MKNIKIFNLLKKAGDSKFVIRKWTIVNDQLRTSYSAGNEVIYSTEVLKSNLCDCSDA